MNAILNSDETTPLVAMESLVAKHGVWTVLVAFAALLVRRKGKEDHVQLDHLSPYLRRDLGLPPVEHVRQYWELR
jgi:hypothetical protein